MKNLVVGFVIGLFLSLMPHNAYSNPGAEEAAVAAAESWLELIDKGEFKKSYQEAATFFKQSISEEDWIATLNQVRGSLGTVSTREEARKQYTTTLPNAPEGEYVVIQYQTDFGEDVKVLETVTPSLEDDNVWRVSGYFIQ